MPPRYSVDELRQIRKSLGDNLPKHNPQTAGYVKLLSLFRGRTPTSHPARNATLVEHSADRFVGGKELVSVNVDTEEGRKQREGRLQLNRLNLANVVDVIQSIHKLGLSHKQLCTFILDTVIVNTERPEDNQQLAPLIRFATGYSSLRPDFLEALASSSLGRFEELCSQGLSPERLSSAAVWLGRLTVGHILPTATFCQALMNLIERVPLASALVAVRTCLVECGEEFDRMEGGPLQELNVFYRFLKENRHPEGYQNFLQADLIARRTNGWRVADTKAIEELRARPDDNGVATSLIAGWDESFSEWFENPEAPVRLPAGPPGLAIGHEVRARQMFALMGRGRIDLQAYASFCAHALAAMFGPVDVGPVLRRILRGITDILPEIGERRPLSDCITDMLAELCGIGGIAAKEAFEIFIGGADWQFAIGKNVNAATQFVEALGAFITSPLALGHAEAIWDLVRERYEEALDVIVSLVLITEKVEPREITEEDSTFTIGMKISSRLDGILESAEERDLVEEITDLLKWGDRWTARVRPVGLSPAIVERKIRWACEEGRIDEDDCERVIQVTRSLGLNGA